MTEEERFWSHVERRGPDACWPWLGTLSDTGLGACQWHGRTVQPRRIAWEIAHGEPPPQGRVVSHHRATQSLCVNPAHLRLRRNGRALITTARVVEIREAREAGETCADLAERYGLTESAVSAICLGRRWPEAGGPIQIPWRRPR